MPANEPALTLFMHPLASYCWKVLVALYENGTPFAREMVEGPPAANAAFRALWPMAKMPVLRDELRGEVVPETSIIIDYLQRHYPGPVELVPRDPDRQLEARLWDRVHDLYVQTPMQKLVADRLRPAEQKDPAGVGDAKATLDAAYAMLDTRMEGRRWMTGDAFTIADCAAMPALFYADVVQPFRASRPALARYFERLLTLDSVRRTIRAAQPYFHLFPFQNRLDPRFRSPEF